MMKYKYNIKYKDGGKVLSRNFKTKQSMVDYLDKNITKVNQLVSPALNFGPIMLPLKQTVWYLDDKN